MLDVPVNEWVQHNEGTQVWYSADNNILPVIKNEIAKQPTAVLYIVGIYDWAYNINPLLFVKGVKKIISVRGMLHPGALSQKPLKKKLFLFLLKLWGWQRKVVFHVTDDAERGFVVRESGIRNEESGIQVAGNFPNLFDVMPMPEKEVGKLKLVSVGLISAMKNYLLILNSLKDVSRFLLGEGKVEEEVEAEVQVKIEEEVKIQYDIYGPIKDIDYWEECKAVIKNMPGNVLVKYHGAVEPAAVEKALAKSHVFILPSKSENYGHSIIEALSIGRPVITSNATPWNGLKEAKAGINVEMLVGNGLAEAIGVFINMPQEELVEWSNACAMYANNAVDLQKIKMQYKNLFAL